jgi:hypothetical protein
MSGGTVRCCLCQSVDRRVGNELVTCGSCWGTCPYVPEIAARFPPPNVVVKKLRVRPCGSRCEPRGMKDFVHRHFDDFINRKDSELELTDFSADSLRCQFNVFLLQLWACSRQR